MTVTYLGPSLAEQRHAAAESRIAELMGVLNATAANVVDVLADVLEHDAWQVAGIHSAEHWTRWRAGVSNARARRLVQIARRRDDLPVCLALFAEGRLTEDTMYEIARRVPRERDAEIAEMAPRMMPAQLAHLLRHLPDLTPPAPLAPEPARKATCSRGADGWVRGEFCLPPDEGEIMHRAFERGRDEVFNEHGDTPLSAADGLVRMAQRALDAMDPSARAGKARGPQAQVIVHVDERTDGVGNAWIHLGPALSDAERRWLCCDASLRYQIEDVGRRLLGISESAPTVDPITRVYVEDRDGGCRFPGCEGRYVQVHHIVHREDGGLTIVTNLVCLCPRHHRQHHQGWFTIDGDPESPDGLVFRNRFGGTIGAPEHERPTSLPSGASFVFDPPTGERFCARTFVWN